MSMSDINEEAFEALVEKALVGSTKEEREAQGITKADVDSQHPDSNQYYWGVPSDFKFKTGEEWAIDTRRLMSFLHATQQEMLDSYKGRKTLEFAIAERITKTIETFGVIKVLREGIDVDNVKLKLWYPKPSAADAEISKEDYMQNQFSITRQQTYSTLHPGDEIDMVLYVNGLPLFTFEWKNPWTGQTARYNGQKQYKEDRNPKDRLLRFGRCLAHFTGDKNEIFFTTKLEGKNTYFMPFNKGFPNGQGAGNPVNPLGHKTSYLWEWVLQKDSVANIIDNYVCFDYGEAKTGKKVPHVLKNAKKLIFPRFHQLENPKTIQAKAEIMMEHFDVKVYHSHKLDNKAKAMVVCKDIECAIHYYQAICDIIAKKKLPYKALIAFSGEKELGGKKYTETTMNGFSDNKTADKFDEEDDNRILVVANKYLTGFDQSKLCAMYIDKPLVDVLAVQSLSRLNRSAPELGKRSEDLFILDFYNTTEDMKKSFEPYYTATALSGYTDVNVLYELKSFLLSIGVFTMEEVVQFSDLFIKGVPADEWSPIIDICAQRFNKEIKFEGNGKADFKMKCKQFVKIYSRTSAILEYEVVEWERLFWFFRVLIPELKVKESEDDDLRDLLNSIDLNTYGTRRTALNQHIDLDPGESTIDPLSPNMVNAGGDDGSLDPLDKIVKEFNERWFKGWKADPQEQKSKLIHLMRHVESDEDYVSLVKDNADKNAADDVMNQILARYVRAMRKGDKSFYDEYKSNDSFQYGLLQAIKGFIANRDYANV